MKKQLLFVLALVTALGAGAAVYHAQALTYIGLDLELGCDSGHFSISWEEIFDRDSTGMGYECYELTLTDGMGTALIEPEHGCVPVGTHYSYMGGHTFYYDVMPEYNPITFRVVSVPLPSTGLPEEVAFVATGECEGLPWVTQPSYPAGFEQRTITCDVPVYNLPGGQPVGDNALKAGQMWHVNPTPVDGPDGQPWTEVYVGSWQRPFIPTACVGN